MRGKEVGRGIFRGGPQNWAQPEEVPLSGNSQGEARFWVVGQLGLEPRTNSLRGYCSTN